MRRLVIAVLFFSLFLHPLSAQSGNASLTGFVQDSSKAFIPGVSVLAVNTYMSWDFIVNASSSARSSSLA